MYVSHKAIDRPRIVLIGVVLVVLLASMAATFVPVQLAPAINTAIVLVTVPYPGSEPTEAEEEITRKIEEALQGLDKVDKVQSTSMRGSSITSVIFLDGVGAKRARDDVAHLVDRVRSELPVGREIQPIITDIDFESLPLMLVNVSAPEGFDERALKQIAEDVKDEIETVEGVSNSQLFGGKEREIHVNVNPDLFAEYGLTVDQIRMALTNFHSKLPGGSLDTSQFDLQIRNETKFRDVGDVRDAVVARRDGRLIRISDVAEVLDTHRRVKSIAQLDGRDTATIIVNKEADINTLKTATEIKRLVAELQKEYPHLKFSVTRDASDEIRLMLWVLGSSAVAGAMFVLIILAWAMGLRISILVLAAIPFSLAIALIFLFAVGVPISNIALFSFILVLGMVVDGAIIVAENIHRHIERGEPPIVAAKTGIDEVGIPVIAADLTTVAAFLPMLLVPGIMGDFLGVMPKVVTAALLGSVIVDHFLIPVAAAYWYRRREIASDEKGGTLVASEKSRVRPNHGFFTRGYAALLRYCLSHRWVVLTCCALAAFWAGWQWTRIGTAFFPESDRGQFTVTYELPLGYSIDETLRASEAFVPALERLQKKGEVIHFVTSVGSSGALAQRLDNDVPIGPEFGQIMVQLTSPTNRERHQNEIIEELRESVTPWPDLKYRIDVVKDGPPGGADVKIRLSGKDLDQLGDMAEALATKMSRLDGVEDVQMSHRPHSPELVVEPDPAMCGLLNVSEAAVARAVQTAVLGDSTIQLSLDDEDVTLRLQAAPEYRRNVSDVARLTVADPTGRRATIGSLADVRRTTGLYAVDRYERKRAVSVRCAVLRDKKNPEKDREYLPDDIFEKLRNEILPELGFRAVDEQQPPAFVTWVKDTFGWEIPFAQAKDFLGRPASDADGVRATFAGENEERDKNIVYMQYAMIVGVVLIFAILAIQFNSFRQTCIVLLTVPLSFIGVIFGMWVSGHPFSMASFIGLLCLAGIVVNDAIVLVDFANQARRRGMRVRHAVLEAGINRLRPVLLTTVTTIGGLLPLYLNFSGGAEFWGPLTGAVIFGLAFATVLTLIVIPVAYTLVYNWADRKKPKTAAE